MNSRVIQCLNAYFTFYIVFLTLRVGWEDGGHVRVGEVVELQLHIWQETYFSLLAKKLPCYDRVNVFQQTSNTGDILISKNLKLKMQVYYLECNKQLV